MSIFITSNYQCTCLLCLKIYACLGYHISLSLLSASFIVYLFG